MGKFTGTHNTKKYTSDLPRSSHFPGQTSTSVTDEALGGSRRFNRRCFSKFTSEAFHFHANKSNFHKMQIMRSLKKI